MKKINLLFLLLFLALNSAWAQTPKIDSLRNVLNHTQGWEERLDAQVKVGLAFHGVSIDSVMHYGNLVLRTSDQHNYDQGRGRALKLIGEGYLYKAQNEQALPYLERSEQAFRASGDKKNLAVVLANTAYAMEMLSRYGECGDKIVACIELAKEMNDTTNLAQAYRHYAEIMFMQNRLDDALDYARKGLATWLLKDDNAFFYYSMIAKTFSKLRQRDSTFYYSEKALKDAEETGIPRYAAQEHNNLGQYYFTWGDYEQADKHYLQSLAYFEKKASNINLPVLYNNLAENENARGNHRLALEYAQKSLPFIEKKRNFVQLSSVRFNLYKSYEGLGNYPEAFKQSLLWKAATDSLNKIDNAKKVAEVEGRYRTREQKATIAEQQLQLERQQSRQWIFLLVGLLLLAAAAGFAFFLRSRRQRAELALQIKAGEAQHLRELDQVKSAFFANISHEFRTPLTLILGPLREMEQGVFKGNATKYFGIMRRNAERLLQLINQLLDLSRLESGKLRLQPRAGDLHAGLRAMAYAFESLADQRQIRYEVQVPSEPLPALFDRDKLEIIVANLLSNAFKFTPEEGRVTFDISSKQAADGAIRLEMQVTDTGIGIPVEQQAHVFNRFYQVENTGSDLQPGSGIGLALTKEIIMLHNGTISLQSPVEADGTGTAFFVTLPFQAADVQAYQAENGTAALSMLPETDAEKTAGPDRPGREAPRHLPVVLIVEDNPDVRTYVVEQLQGQYRVMEAPDGKAALEIARAELPDLILSDLMMPLMDGAALTRLVKSDERTSHIPVILLTAKAGQPDRLQGLETGAEAYLTKPFDAEELRLVIANTIAQRQVLRDKFSKEIRLGLPMVSAPSVDDLFLQKVLACIEENLDDDLFGVEQLAASVNMSRSNLFRKLDALTGKSPTTIIRELRLARAKSLLEQGAGNTTEISFMVGFNTPAYFVKCFTDEYGISPGEMRKRK